MKNNGVRIIRSVLIAMFLLLNHVNWLFGMEGGGGTEVARPVDALSVGQWAAALTSREVVKEKPQKGITWKSPAWKVPDDLGVVDKNVLKKKAETEGYGYKTTNLVELKGLSAKLNKSLLAAGRTYAVDVPEFVGISSGTMQVFLKQHKVDIADTWRSLLEKHFSGETASSKKNQMFKDKKFPEGFFADVKRTLVGPIANAFDEAAKDPEATALGLPDGEKAALNELMAGAKDKRLMVRSTGKEDTDKLANAGGNETKANVVPAWPDVIEAMGEVVVSYFSEKSLIQRLGAGDKTLFEEPMTPVLVQRMVGEKADGETELDNVPRCGVMFTEEPECGLSRRHLDAPVKPTSGVTIIQASYGHNEGVVNSIVPVDTYYVDMFGNIFPVIRPKFFRIIPLEGSGKLGRSELHSDDWSYVPALNQEEIAVLKLLAVSLERYYQGPMDVEYVIDRAGDVPTIWIVQARPIVHNPHQPVPSYLKSTVILGKIACEAIGVAGGALRVIGKQEQCIARETIREALEVYQHEETNCADVKCIIIGQHAPATSHEATTFRSELKPVVYTKDVGKVESLLSTLGEDMEMIVDVQRGIIAPWKKTTSLDAALITGKWISYPIPAKMSLWPRRVKSDKVRRIIHDIGVDGLMNLDEDLAEQIRLIGQNVVFINDPEVGLSEKLKSSSLSKDVKDVHALLYKKFWNAVLLQQVALGKSGEIVDGYSVATFTREIKADAAARKALKETAVATDSYVTQLLKLKDVALSPLLSEKWTVFLTNKFAGATKDDKQAFVALIYTLGQLGALELWFHTEFVRLGLATAPEVKAVVDKCWDLGTQIFLKELAKKKMLLAQTDLNGVADPAKFKKVWDDFCTNMVDYFITDKADGFIAGIGKAKITGKIAAIQVMDDFVSVLDGALKEMSRSKLYEVFTGESSLAEAERIKTNKDKGFVFAMMLNKYLEVLQKWYAMIPEGVLGSCSGLLNTDVPSIVKSINWGRPEAFVASSDFNVAAAVIGATGIWQPPQTLEDVFTFIHQSLLAVIATLSKSFGLALAYGAPFGSVIPPELREIDATLQQQLYSRARDAKSSPVSLIGTALDKGVLHLFYNWPQRNHSAAFELVYDKGNKTRLANVTLTLRFFGHDHRWLKIADFVAFRTSVLRRLPSERTVVPFGVSISWKGGLQLIKKNMEDIRSLCTHISACAVGGELMLDWIDEGNYTDFLEYWASHTQCYQYFVSAEAFKFLQKDNKRQLKALTTMLDNLDPDSTSSYRSKSVEQIGLSRVNTIFLRMFIVQTHLDDDFLAKNTPKALQLACDGIKDSNVRPAAIELLKLLLEKAGGNTQAVVRVAQDWIVSADPVEQAGAFELWELLFEKDVGFDAASGVVAENVNSANELVKKVVENLWQKLYTRLADTLRQWDWDKEKFSEEAKNAATAGMQSTNKSVKQNALTLWNTLVGGGKFFTFALNVVERGLGDENADVAQKVRILWATLCSTLIKFVQARSSFEDALQIARQGVVLGLNDTNVLWRTLFAQGHGFDDALQVVTTLIQNEDPRVRRRALDLCLLLVESMKVQGTDLFLGDWRKQFVAVTNGAAERGIGSTDADEQEFSQRLLVALLKQGQSFEQLAALIEKQDHKMRKVALKVCAQVVVDARAGEFEFDTIIDSKREQFFAIVKDAAAWGAESKDDDDQWMASSLWQWLFERGQGFLDERKAEIAIKSLKRLVASGQCSEIAKDAALKYVQNEVSDVRRAALELWQVLVEEEHVFAEAMAAVKIMLESKDFHVRHDSLILWEILLENLAKWIPRYKQDDFKVALDAASTGVQIMDEVLNSMATAVETKALALWKALFEKDYGFDEAITLVSTHVKKYIPYYRTSSGIIKLWEIVLSELSNNVREGLFFEQAGRVLVETLKMKAITPYNANLLPILTRVGNVFAKAMFDTLKDLSYTHAGQLKLWQCLVEVVGEYGFAWNNDPVFDAAQKAAAMGTKLYDENIRREALDLWRALLKKGWGVAQARNLAVDDDVYSNVKTQLKDLLKPYEVSEPEPIGSTDDPDELRARFSEGIGVAAGQ